MTTGKVAERDVKLAHKLVSEYANFDNMGRLRSEIAKALATVRQEEQRAFINNITAVLNSDDVEAFTALVMKAKQSPDLDSSTRSALKSEMEIRQEEREGFSATLVLHLQAKADALDVRQETECPSGTAFNSEALLRRQIAFEVAELESTAKQER